MDRAFRAAKRAAAEERTPKKRKRGESLPGTPAQSEEPAARAASPASPPRKRQLFANAVQLSRHVKVRCLQRPRRLAPAGGKLASAQHALLRRAPLTPPRASPPAPTGSCCMPTTTCARR